MSDDLPAGGILPRTDVSEDPPADVQPIETSFSELSTDEKLEYLAGTVAMTQQQVAWLCQQLYQAMEAVKSNPMLRKVMGG